VDKRGQAQVLLEDAQRSLSKALSLLGGKTRNKPKEFPPRYKYITRQYLESIIIRLRVTQLVLAQRKQDHTIKPSAFADEYEKERKEQC
jgi:hypothetical protein